MRAYLLVIISMTNIPCEERMVEISSSVADVVFPPGRLCTREQVCGYLE